MSEMMLDAISEIDSKYIDGYFQTQERLTSLKKTHHPRRFAGRACAAAACLLVLVIALPTIFIHNNSDGDKFLNSEENKLKARGIYVCNDPATDFNTDENIIYNSAEKTYTLPKITTFKKSDKPNKEFTLGTEKILLEYSESYNKEYRQDIIDSYFDKTLSIRVDFDEKGNLAFIRPEEHQYKVTDEAIEDEAAFVEICKTFLSGYADMSRYKPSSLTTFIIEKSENAISGDIESGFIKAENPNNDYYYRINFTYYLNGIPTTDRVRIGISSDGYLEFMSLDENPEFQKFENLEFNYNECEKLMDEEMSKLCTIENYTYTGYTKSRRFIILDDTLCLVVTATPEYEQPNSIENDIIPIKLLIPFGDFK